VPTPENGANGSTAEEIDPFVKRVTTVRKGDVVIFQYLGTLTPELVEDLTERFAPKMGDISYVVIDKHFDITVLKQAKENKVFVA
jgi:hypothetical protein